MMGRSDKMLEIRFYLSPLKKQPQMIVFDPPPMGYPPQ